jgi:dienelactone hydrolase
MPMSPPQGDLVDHRFVALDSPAIGRAGAGGHPCQGLWWTPRHRNPAVALIATHYNVDFSEHYLAEYLARRGLGFLGWNTRFRGDETHFLLDHAIADIGAGVRWLREEAGVEHVVLLGNSGGGSLMAAYHSEAVEPVVRPAPGLPPAAGLDRLTPGDAYIALAAHPGRPEVLTAWMDASVTDEGDPVSVDPALDLWNPDNGPPYPADFVARYRQAQRGRNERITDWALAELERLAPSPASDRVFNLCRVWADPRMVDPSIEPTNRPPNSCYLGDPRRANYSVWGIGMSCTLRSWLSMWSLRTSQCQAAPHLAKVRVPALVINADADTGVFPSDAAAIAGALAATDKTVLSMAGEHYFRQPDGARDAVADEIAGWVAARFPD